MLKCLLDMDGVLVDCEKGLCKVHNRKSPFPDKKNLGQYDMAPLWGMSGEEMFRPCEHDFWANLDFMLDAHKILSLVENRFGQENICILSSPTRNLGCMSGKLAWLQKNLPQYSRRFLFGSQKQFCAHSKTVLIDDRDSNVDSFIAHGGRAFLVARPWNRAHMGSHDMLFRMVDFLEGLR